MAVLRRAFACAFMTLMITISMTSAAIVSLEYSGYKVQKLLLVPILWNLILSLPMFLLSYLIACSILSRQRRTTVDIEEGYIRRDVETPDNRIIKALPNTIQSNCNVAKLQDEQCSICLENLKSEYIHVWYDGKKLDLWISFETVTKCKRCKQGAHSKCIMTSMIKTKKTECPICRHDFRVK